MPKGFLSLFEKGVVRSLYVSIGKGLRELWVESLKNFSFEGRVFCILINITKTKN